MPLRALIFDVDGTLAETEELHRRAFNDAFKACGLDWHWDRALYCELLQTTGGKERIAAYVARHRQRQFAKSALQIPELHALKTKRYTALAGKGQVGLRVRRLGATLSCARGSACCNATGTVLLCSSTDSRASAAVSFLSGIPATCGGM